MLIVLAEVKIKAETRDDAIAAAIEMMEATHKEEGCIAYNFYTDVADPTVIRIVEKWESDEALLAHFQTPHMAAFGAKMPAFVDGPVTADKYYISKSEPIGG